MWDLPGPGIEPVSSALAGGFLTTVPSGKFLVSVFEILSIAPILVLGTRRKGTPVSYHGLLSKLELKYGKPDCHRYAEVLVPVPSCLPKSPTSPWPSTISML